MILEPSLDDLLGQYQLADLRGVNVITQAIGTLPENECEPGLLARMFSGNLGQLLFMLDHPEHISKYAWIWRTRLTTATESEEFWDTFNALLEESK